MSDLSYIARRGAYLAVADALDALALNPALADDFSRRLKQDAMDARRDGDILIHTDSKAWFLLVVASHHHHDCDPDAPLDPQQSFRLTLAFEGLSRRRRFKRLTDRIDAALAHHGVEDDDPFRADLVQALTVAARPPLT